MVLRFYQILCCCCGMCVFFSVNVFYFKYLTFSGKLIKNLATHVVLMLRFLSIIVVRLILDTITNACTLGRSGAVSTDKSV